jgi:hypothetical protein
MKKFFYILFLIAGCKEAYNPPIKNVNIDYLVVEGNIEAGNDSTIVHLTRTIPVNDTSIIQPELNATVTVESEDGESYQLQSEQNGFYSSASLNINISKKYRLHIFTGNGKEYASDYVPVLQTPPIDSVSWKFDADGNVNIYVNTHDATNQAQYYRWQYTETWEHVAFDSSTLIYDPNIGSLRARLPEEEIYSCWTINTSGEIIIASTTDLSSNVIYEQPLVHIPYQSEKLNKVYSIIVTQEALSKEAFEFWQNLKKNTEEIGSIFDPQPFADFGNMYCISNPAEPVIGFISANSNSVKRIYINWLQILWPYIDRGCVDTTISDPLAFSTFAFIPIRDEPFKGIIGNTPECADCRLQGGSTIRPPYMP